MEWQKYFNSETFQKRLLIGLCLMLLGTVAILTAFLNWQFQAKIVQLENAAVSNNARLVDINNFLVDLDKQLKAQKSQAGLMDALSGLSAEPQQ